MEYYRHEEQHSLPLQCPDTCPTKLVITGHHAAVSLLNLIPYLFHLVSYHKQQLSFPKTVFLGLFSCLLYCSLIGSTFPSPTANGIPRTPNTPAGGPVSPATINFNPHPEVHPHEANQTPEEREEITVKKYTSTH